MGSELLRNQHMAVVVLPDAGRSASQGEIGLGLGAFQVSDPGMELLGLGLIGLEGFAGLIR